MLRPIIFLVIGIILGSIFGAMTIYNRVVNFTTDQIGPIVKTVITSNGSGSTGSVIPGISTTTLTQQLNKQIISQKTLIKTKIKEQLDTYITNKLNEIFK